MKLLTQKKPRDFRINVLANKEIKLTVLSLLVFTFQTTVASEIKTSENNYTALFFEKTIKGTVTDQNGMPLPGANVVVKGSSKGVQTDVDGSFAITVAYNVTKLVINYIGMEMSLIHI